MDLRNTNQSSGIFKVSDSIRHIAIAGAGISGMTSAIYLKQNGVPVTIYEKRDKIGGRFKGDWQGIENWTSPEDVLEEIQGMSLDLSIPQFPLPSLKLLVGGDQVYDIKTKRPLCYLVKRGNASDTLDQALYRRTQELKIPVHFNSRMKPKAVDIVATGPSSKKIFAADLGIRFRTEHPDIAVALVDNKAAHKGYAYLLIVDGYGCLCTVLFKKFTGIRSQLAIARKTIQKHFNVSFEDEQEVGGIGAYAINDHHNLSGTYVGEAGGLQDFLFGFGIRTAMQSGVLAAKSIVEGFDYRKRAKEVFIGDQKAGLVNRYLYERIGSMYGGYGFMSRLVNRNSNPNYFLNKTYQYNFIHKIFYSLASKSMKGRYEGIL